MHDQCGLWINHWRLKHTGFIFGCTNSHTLPQKHLVMVSEIHVLMWRFRDFHNYYLIIPKIQWAYIWNEKPIKQSLCDFMCSQTSHYFGVLYIINNSNNNIIPVDQQKVIHVIIIFTPNLILINYMCYLLDMKMVFKIRAILPCIIDVGRPVENVKIEINSYTNHHEMSSSLSALDKLVLPEMESFANSLTKLVIKFEVIRKLLKAILRFYQCITDAGECENYIFWKIVKFIHAYASFIKWKLNYVPAIHLGKTACVLDILQLNEEI